MPTQLYLHDCALYGWDRSPETIWRTISQTVHHLHKAHISYNQADELDLLLPSKSPPSDLVSMIHAQTTTRILWEASETSAHRKSGQCSMAETYFHSDGSASLCFSVWAADVGYHPQAKPDQKELLQNEIIARDWLLKVSGLSGYKLGLFIEEADVNLSFQEAKELISVSAPYPKLIDGIYYANPDLN